MLRKAPSDGQYLAEVKKILSGFVQLSVSAGQDDLLANRESLDRRLGILIENTTRDADADKRKQDKPINSTSKDEACEGNEHAGDDSPMHSTAQKKRLFADILQKCSRYVIAMGYRKTSQARVWLVPKTLPLEAEAVEWARDHGRIYILSEASSSSTSGHNTSPNKNTTSDANPAWLQDATLSHGDPKLFKRFVVLGDTRQHNRMRPFNQIEAQSIVPLSASSSSFSLPTGADEAVLWLLPVQSYFKGAMAWRELCKVYEPFLLTNATGLFDVYVHVIGGGPTGKYLIL
jgi:hypothetical protein